jgi:hypothetical protein
MDRRQIAFDRDLAVECRRIDDLALRDGTWERTNQGQVWTAPLMPTLPKRPSTSLTVRTPPSSFCGGSTALAVIWPFAA